MEPTAAKGYIIHLPSATEREAHVRALQDSFFIPLEVVAASTGADWLARPEIRKRHIRPGQPVTQGMLGCAQSHLELLYTYVKGTVATATAPATDLYIFEDDCELTTAPAAIAHWVDQVKQSGAPWDILLLGANEYVESQAGWIRIDETAAEFPLTRVQRFWGTHAMVIRPTAARAALKVFAEAQRAGTFLPADWMWNEAIRQEGLLAFGPLQPKSFCRQVPGLVSAITGIMRLGQI